MGYLILTIAMMALTTGIVNSDYVNLVNLADALYREEGMTSENATMYLAEVFTLLNSYVMSNGEYLADFLIEVSHIADFIVSMLEGRDDYIAGELDTVGIALVNITELQMQGISQVTCRTGQTVDCSLSAIKAVPLVNATEECLIRIMMLIIATQDSTEIEIKGINMTSSAAKIPMLSVTSVPRICGILSIPTLQDDALTDYVEIEYVYIFVLASRTNMYAFLDDTTNLNSGTVRSFARDFEGRILEIFKEINLFIEALYDPTDNTPIDPDSGNDKTGLNITTDLQSDTDGGSFTITLATLQNCTTYINEAERGYSYHVKTTGTATILEDTSSNQTDVYFEDQTLSLILYPPVNPMAVNVHCESCMQQADVVFLADTSGSVGALNFLKIVLFMKNLVSRLDVAPDRIRIGLATFGLGARLEFHLNAYDNASAVINAIEDTFYHQGIDTQTHLGLKVVREDLFPHARENVQRLLIVITDGESSDYNETVSEADLLRQDGVEIVAVAVGLHYNLNEINAIANDPDEYHAFLVDDFDALQFLQIVDTICNGAWSNVSSQGSFSLLSGYTLDDVTLAWKRSPALQLKAMEENAAVFKSSFFGTFGFDLFAEAPEQINFDEVFTDFDKKVAENPYVLAVNCALIGALVIGSVILRRFDKKDEDQWHYKPLDDNPDNENNVYFISVHTGLWSSSSFTSTPYIIVDGMCSSTGVRVLKAGSNQNLFRWKYSNFALGTLQPLGPLISVKIWHDDQEQSSRLYIDKIIIADGYTGLKYVFLCEEWLASDRADGCTHRTFFPADEEFQDGKTLFNSVARFSFFDQYLWLSIFGRPSFSRFTRVQRLNCLTTMFSLSMLGSAMWFNSGDDKHVYGIKLGHFQINYKQIYVGLMSTFISFPAAIIIGVIFRNRRFWSESKNKGMDKYKTDITFNDNKPSAALPWFFIFVGYGLVVSCIATATFFSTLYSIQWGSEVSKDWLMSIFLGAGNEVAFIEPIKTVLQSIVLAGIFKAMARSTISEMAPLQIGNHLIRGSRAKPSQWPGDIKDSHTKARMKKLMILNRRLFLLIKGFFGKLLYIGILVLICSHNVVEDAYLQNFQLTKQLKPLKKMNKTADVWDWLRNHYSDRVFPKLWYNGRPRLPPERKYMSDYISYRMGPVRLRQKRVTGKCEIPKVMRKSISVCQHEYDEKYEDTSGYCPEWTAYRGSCDGSGFTYASENETSALSYTGTFGTYSGGGYVKDINPFEAEVTHEINKLYNSKWIDEKTRLVIVENMVFNPNTNLFSLVSIIFEFPGIGGIYMTSKAQTARLYPYVNVWDFLVLAAQGVFLLVTFVNAILLVYDVWNLKLKCFTSLEFWAKFVSTGFASAAVAMYIIRIDRTIYIVEEIFNSAEKFLSFEIVVQYDDIYKLCISIVLFISILMLLKPLTFNYYLYMMKTSILVSKGNIFSFSVILAIAMTAFACVVHLYIGATSYSFRSLTSSYLTLFRTLLAMVTLRELMGSSDQFEAELIFTVFIFTMTLILINVFISILNDAFSFVKDGKGGGSVEPFDEDLNNHFWWKVEKLFNCYSNKNDNSPKPNKGRGQGFSALNQQIDSLSHLLLTKNRETAGVENQIMKAVVDRQFPN